MLCDVCYVKRRVYMGKNQAFTYTQSRVLHNYITV